MKMKRTLEVSESDGVRGLKIALEMVPDDANYAFLTKWVGYGSGEREEVSGIEFSWTEEV